MMRSGPADMSPATFHIFSSSRLPCCAATFRPLFRHATLLIFCRYAHAADAYYFSSAPLPSPALHLHLPSSSSTFLLPSSPSVNDLISIS